MVLCFFFFFRGAQRAEVVFNSAVISLNTVQKIKTVLELKPYQSVSLIIHNILRLCVLIEAFLQHILDIV